MSSPTLNCAFSDCTLVASAGRCSRCLITAYCSPEHQKQHWKLIHKTECNMHESIQNIPQSIRQQFKNNKIRTQHIDNRNNTSATCEVEACTLILDINVPDTVENIKSKIFIGEEKDATRVQDQTTVDLIETLFKHSCYPNCVLIEDTSSIKVVTQVAISPGTELTISYYPWATNNLPLLIRQELLQSKSLKAKCECKFCCMEKPQDEDMNNNRYWETFTSFTETSHNDNLGMTTTELDNMLSECFKTSQLYKLNGNHWLISLMRMEFVNKILSEKQEASDVVQNTSRRHNLITAYEFTREAIYRNSEKMSGFALAKSNFFFMLKSLGLRLDKPEKEIYIDCCNMDGFYEQYRYLWFNKHPKKFTDDKNDNIDSSKTTLNKKPNSTQIKLKRKLMAQREHEATRT